MAMESVDNALVQQFADTVHVAAQQTKARLRPYVEIIKLTGDNMAYDGLGTVEAREITARFEKVVWDDIEHTRRELRRRRFAVTLPIDRADVRGMLTNPQGRYVTAVVAAMERVFDRLVIEAMFADVKTGRNFSDTVTFAADGGQTVNATGGVTYAKVLEVGQNFIDNEVGNESPIDVVMGISGKEHTALMNITELTSGDYSRAMPVDGGEIQRAGGMTLIKFGGNVTRPMLPVSAGTRTSFAMAKGGVVVGLSQAWKIAIQDRSAEYYETDQVQIIGELGAVRTDGKLIQKFTTTA